MHGNPRQSLPPPYLSHDGYTPAGLNAFFTFATGIVYGLQPDALFVIVPALALPTKLAATLYILMFVLGTVSAMGGYTFAIGGLSETLRTKNPESVKWLSVGSSVVALLVGMAVVLSGLGWVSIPGF